MSNTIMGIEDNFCEAAAELGLYPPGFTRYGEARVMITALPCGRGEDAAPNAENPVGSIAGFAQKNFYRELVTRLRSLLRRAGETVAKEARIFCNSRLPEKELAVRAGLGFAGKNSLLIIPGAGSLFVLGGILFPGASGDTPKPPAALEADGMCGNCEACIAACPTGAIKEGGRIDLTLCIQAHAAQVRSLPSVVRDAWGIRLYGCGVCQDVCPHNDAPPPCAQTACGHIGPSVSLAKILAAGDTKLRKALFKGTTLDVSWISPVAIKRNAIIAAAHQKAHVLLPVLERYRRHTHPLLRETAVWAITKHLETTKKRLP